MKAAFWIKRIGLIYLYLVGVFFIMMSFDCFSVDTCPDCDSLGGKLICFSMSILPGLIVIIVTYLLRNKDKILGTVMIALSVFAFFFFKFYREFTEKILTLVIIVVIPLAIGITFIITSKNKS